MNPPTHSKNFLLGGILALALVLRLGGIQFGLPYLYHADEPIVVNHALAYGAGDLNPHFFKVPPLISYLLFLIYGLAYVVGRGAGFFKHVSDFENLFFRDPTFFYLTARIFFGAVLGTVSVYVLYRLIRRHFSEAHALVSAFFLAVAFLHVRDSHFIYADIPLVLVLIGAFFIFLALAEGRPGWKVHLAAGALIGLATGIKYNGILVSIPYLAATLFGNERKKWLAHGMVAAGGAFFVYTLTNPFTWMDSAAFHKEISMQASASGKTGFLHHLIYSLNGGIGPLLLAAGLGGMAASLIQKEKKRRVIASFVIGYYLLLVFRSQPYDRYVLPLIPFILFFAADFLIRVSKSVLKGSRGLFILALLFALPSVAKSILSDLIFLKKDVRTEAKEWVEARIEPGKGIALDWSFYLPRLNFSDGQLQTKLRQIESLPHFSKAQEGRIKFLLSQKEKQKGYALYFLSEGESKGRFLFEQPAAPYDLDKLKQEKVEYVLIARVQKEYHPAEFYRELKEKAVLIRQFSPYRDPHREYPIDLQPLTGGPFLWKELISRERNGQPIEIYQIQ